MNKKTKLSFKTKQLLAYTISLLLISLIQTTIFAENISESKKICAACHGVNGISSSEIFPNLAGQKSDYIAQQVKDIRDGVRKNPVMDTVVKDLTDQQIDALADYFSNQQAMKAGSSEINQQGKNARAVCISCHGIRGLTVNGEWPNLAGQKKAYLQKQLLAFRDDSRYGPSMQVIAKELSEEQIEAVAEYYSQVPAGY